jgi:hypothetical protein
MMICGSGCTPDRAAVMLLAMAAVFFFYLGEP